MQMIFSDFQVCVGNNSDTVSKEIETEKMGGVEFSTKKTQSMSKIGPLTRQGINDHFAATSSKKVSGVCKYMYSGSFSPEGDDPHYYRGWKEHSGPILQKGDDLGFIYLLLFLFFLCLDN